MIHDAKHDRQYIFHPFFRFSDVPSAKVYDSVASNKFHEIINPGLISQNLDNQKGGKVYISKISSAFNDIFGTKLLDTVLYMSVDEILLYVHFSTSPCHNRVSLTYCVFIGSNDPSSGFFCNRRCSRNV